MTGRNTPRFIAVKDFERFQHYKGRTPPWIKFYNALLDDYRFLQLPDAARSQLMLIWLVASRHQNRIPYDEKYIAQAIHSTTKVQLDRLLESGWLYVAFDAPPQADRKQDASKVDSTSLAERSTLSIPEREREEEREKEIETEKEREKEREVKDGVEAEAAGSATTDQLVPVAYEAEIKTLFSRVAQPATWRHEMRSMLDGMPGHHHPNPEQLGRAIRDFLGNGKDRHPNLRQFRRYVEGAIAEDKREPQVNGSKRTRRLSPAEQSFENTRVALGDLPRD